MPSTREKKTKTVSRVSFSTLRNRMIASAPNRPKAVTILLPITNITMETTRVNNTSDCVNAREYDNPS